jgi:hypothetical protein
MIRQGIRSPRTAEIIGISHQDFLDWIEFQFTESMNWKTMAQSGVLNIAARYQHLT